MAAAPGQAPPVAAGGATDEEIQRFRDRFDHYWTGRYDWWRAEHAAGRRRPIFTQLRVPKRRPPGPQRPLQPEAPALRADGSRAGWPPPRPAAQDRLQRYMTDVQNGQYQVMRYMRPLGYRLVKILGRGGFGVACLFEMTDVDGKIHKIVVKAGTGRDLQLERSNIRVSPESCCSNFPPQS